MVIVCPLNWGLGHASRCIPIINKYLNSGYEVLISASGTSGKLLRINFPQLKFYPEDPFTISYTYNSKFLFFSLICQVPKMIIYFLKERRFINQLVLKYNPEIIVSDNRYGLFHKKTYSIIITHQISPILPAYLSWAEYPVYLILRFFIKKFTECWIPDYADNQNNLSGILSHRFKLPLNSKFIGILSRFISTVDIPYNEIYKYDIVIILSGPQPQLKILMELLSNMLMKTNYKTLIVSGFQSVKKCLTGNLTFVEHLRNEELKHCILNANLVICRAGYSSIMDLVALNRTAILIPTPGQTEQEYLGSYLNKKKFFKCVEQHKIESIDFEAKYTDYSFEKIFNNGVKLPIS